MCLKGDWAIWNAKGEVYRFEGFGDEFDLNDWLIEKFRVDSKGLRLELKRKMKMSLRLCLFERIKLVKAL